MKSPIDVVKGRIVGYDPRTEELTIVARYPDWPMMLKREYSECNVQLIDGRPLSGQQRKTCYALIRAISDFTGMGLDPTKEYMKIKFLTEDLEQTADQIFSLSNAPMSLVCAFQRFLVHFILDWDIPCNIPLLEFVDDTQDYIYACLVTKKCCICGLPADLHHEDAVGAGRDRTEIVHEGMEVLPLCRCHHTERHTVGDLTFKKKYHIERGVILDKKLCKIYGLKAKREGSEKDAQQDRVDGEAGGRPGDSEYTERSVRDHVQDCGRP